MNIELLTVGKTDLDEVERLVQMYAKRINFSCKFSITSIPDVRSGKKQSISQLKRNEADALMRLLDDSDYVVLLDEHGEEFGSIEFAQWMQKRMNSGVKRLVFIIGGAYGFDERMRQRASSKISLSKMTFSHQIIRAIFAEQLYRAFSIINNEPYHNE